MSLLSNIWNNFASQPQCKHFNI